MIRIEEARSMHGWSQAQLAAKIGTSQQQVDRWEKPNIDVKSSVLVAVSLYDLTRTRYVFAVPGGFFIRA